MRLAFPAASEYAFAQLAVAAPTGRLGQTMGGGEIGRELGDAGAPILVGAFSPIGIAAGLLALAAAITVAAATSIRVARPGGRQTIRTDTEPAAPEPPNANHRDKTDMSDAAWLCQLWRPAC